MLKHINRVLIGTLIIIGIIGVTQTSWAEEKAPVVTKQGKQLCVVYQYRKPYEYIIDNHGIKTYNGLDIEILRHIINIDQTIAHLTLNWSQGLAAIKNGQCDIMLGTFSTTEREEYGYFSIPYRQAEDSLFVQIDKRYPFKDLPDLLSIIQSKQFRLGVIKDIIYTLPELNNFIREHPTLITHAADLEDLIDLKLKNKIDGFFGDTMVVQTYLWETGFYKQISPIDIKAQKYPVRFLFSKKLFTPEMIHSFDTKLISLKQSWEYKALFRSYSVPIFIGMTTNSWPYRVVELIGTIFFTLSGLILAREVKFNLTGAFILAMLPSMGGGLIRDVILNRDPPSMFRTPMYFLAVLCTTALIYTIIRLARYFHSSWLNKCILLIDHHVANSDRIIVRITDAVGMAVFTIIGVMVAVEVRITPLLLWAPILAVLSSTGGGILRDFFMGRDLNRTFYYETPFVWSFFLTGYILIRTMDMTSTEIAYAIFITQIGIILTRFIILKKGWETKDFWA